VSIVGIETGAMSGADADAASSPATPVPKAESATPEQDGRRARKRVERPEIDLDANIRDARITIQRAQAALTQARQQAKADRRKKARLIKKACHLSPADVERIAVLKRCGFSGIEHQSPTPPAPASASSGSAREAPSSAAGAAGSASSGTDNAGALAPTIGGSTGSSAAAPASHGAAGHDSAADSPPGDEDDAFH